MPLYIFTEKKELKNLKKENTYDPIIVWSLTYQIFNTHLV